MMHRFVHILLFSLAVTQYGSAETNLRTATTPAFASSSHQRRELSVSGFWYTLLNMLHVPCPANHTEDHPQGHCAHPSHHPHPKKKSGGSSSSSHSSSSSSSHSSSSSGWGGDSYETGTASTAAASDSWSSGWSSSKTYSMAISEPQNSSSGNGRFWGIGTMCAALVGTIAFIVTKKRNHSAGEDVYVGADGNYFTRDVGADETSVSRVASIRTSLSHGVFSKFGKKNQSNDGTGDYQAPV